MPSLYDKVVSVIEKDPENRTDFECQELVYWFRLKSAVFANLKAEIVADVIRHCSFIRRKRDDVIIKQGDVGDSLYIILKGQVSIHVIQEKENEKDIKAQIDRACGRVELDRDLLGQHVWIAGDGKTVGEIALIKEEYTRTASVVVDEDTDLISVDKSLYIRSVGTVLEEEYRRKNHFVETSQLFATWATKQKKQLVISLKMERHQYGTRLTRQGHAIDYLYFILSGESEVVIDHRSYKDQYHEQWSELESLLPGLLPPATDLKCYPHDFLRQRRSVHKPKQMCLLGSNEIIGGLEAVLGLGTYVESTTVCKDTDFLVLSKGNYQRLFGKKSATQTIDLMRKIFTSRIYLYIHRSSIAHVPSPFLKYLALRLMNTDTIKDLKAQSKRAAERASDKSRSNGMTVCRRLHYDDKDVERVMKKMHMQYVTNVIQMPDLETSERIIEHLEDRLHQWVVMNNSKFVSRFLHSLLNPKASFDSNEKNRMPNKIVVRLRETRLFQRYIHVIAISEIILTSFKIHKLQTHFFHDTFNCRKIRNTLLNSFTFGISLLPTSMNQIRH
ncbi:hypothetical protein ScPMuIL_017466 [Solemya velum]